MSASSIYTDYLDFFGDSVETTVPASVQPNEAAARIWAAERGDASPSHRSPLVDSPDGPVEQQVEARSSLSVSSVIPLLAVFSRSKDTSAPLVQDMRAYAVIAREGKLSAAFVIGRGKHDSWRYRPEFRLPSSPLATSIQSLNSAGAKDIVLVATIREGVETDWWLASREGSSFRTVIPLDVAGDLEIGQQYDAQTMLKHVR